MIASTTIPSAPAPESSVSFSQLPGLDREHFRTLLRRLPCLNATDDDSVRLLGVTSCRSGEGVSTIASGLSIAAAESGSHRILLVDFHLNRPTVASTFHVTTVPGLAEMLPGGRPLDSVIRRTSLPNLFLLTSGGGDGDPSLVYDSDALPRFAASLKDEFDLVVFDMPPAGEASSTTRLAGRLDGVLLVVEAQQATVEDALRTKQLLTRCGARLVGAIMNKYQEHLPNWLRRTLKG
jgi:capsular exopolysaccharide synthesis family protein